MSAPAVRAAGLSKRFRIGRRVRYKSLRESLQSALTAPFRRGGPTAETIWALRDVSFEIEPGEVVGVIGRNGAGKSTLLKVLARITEPTEGRVELRGRVGSLLEVGTGFHLELTGRENIFLSGAILGMKRAEIVDRFDEIVAFAEIERFLDTPVKHYSTGMYLRLAFAVAAHLEPEILLVDEVLAVGDADFQKKCLGKMGDVAHGGRTVLFVSHNTGAVNRLCRRAIWLDQGALRLSGQAEQVVEAYLTASSDNLGEQRWHGADAPAAAGVRLLAVRLLDHRGATGSALDWRHPFSVEMEYEVERPQASMQVGFWITTADGTMLFVAGDRENDAWRERSRDPGRYLSRARVPGKLLNAGGYVLGVGADVPVGSTVIRREPALRFTIEQTEMPHHSSHGAWRPAGVLCLSLPWEIVPSSPSHPPAREG